MKRVEFESGNIFHCHCGKDFDIRKYRVGETFHCHKDTCFRVKS